ncbi:hypothetical protein BCR32DRAFT_289519 [Anaeromyces robustus]|uniref:Uncharacterized protein n=1 Tax=Anaeromyces robustus TaxID=1754192 RepID=A0A1Y1XMY9_9FUNG|nr:hypothetical protein BCR32DRAFT_289519 [Anaeromyces robustus]|eukprot:ORX87120.1 hypothetical protein BCR32DRAFT_289519 [Anaeromyces robustus]
MLKVYGYKLQDYIANERTYMYCDKPYKDTYESDECYSLDCVNEICTMTLSKEGSNPEDSFKL